MASRNVTVWRNIIKIGEDMLKEGINIEDFFVRNIGDGNDIRFWDDLWVGNSPLKLSFSRLYRIEINKECTIQDRVSKSGGGWVFNWAWSRPLTGRLLGEVEALTSLIIGNASIGTGNSSWVCNMNNNNIYITKTMAAKLDNKIIPRDCVGSGTIRNNLIPQKIGIFIWRVLKGRIAVKTELDKRGIALDSLLCPICNNDPESTFHAIFSCKTALDVWVGIFKWWKLNFPGNVTLDILLGGDGYGDFSGFQARIWQAIVWTTSYFIWKNRNQKVFNKDSWVAPKIICEVQVRSYEWIGNRTKRIHKEWLQWLHDPSKVGQPDSTNYDPG